MHTVSLSGAEAPPRVSPPPVIAPRGAWPAERVELLRRLFEAELSHQAIADRMGVAKGVISAKVARLNWRRHETGPKARPAPAADPVAGPERFKRLEALGPAECHWPTVEDAQGVQLFCACRRKAGAIYCESHQARARRRPRVWEQRILEPARKPPPKAGLGWDRFGER